MNIAATTRVVIVLVCSVLTLVPVRGAPEAQNPPFSGDWCILEYTAETQNRHVYGSVNTECGSCSGHTPPFGNWGVNSFYGSVWDGDQYKGWATYNAACGEVMDDPEWNSCTSEFPPPSNFGPMYYNHPMEGDRTSQFSADITSLGRVFDYWSTSEDEGCSIMNERQIAGGTVLEIREIDPWSPDDPVTNLPVGSGVATLSCNQEGCFPVATEWGGGSNDITSTEFRVRLIGSHHYREGKGL